MSDQINDLQKQVEAMEWPQLHLSNLLTLAEPMADEELHTLIAAARVYANQAFAAWEEAARIVKALAEKEGAQ